jgi:hypothetical protein
VKLILLYVFLFSITVSFAQTKRLPPPPVVEKIVRTKAVKFSLQKRISFYPFNKSSQIKIVSFGLQAGINQQNLNDKYILPKFNDTISFSELDQIKTLTLHQIDTLSDILYNECSRWNIREYKEAGCYYPRNAFLFYDDKQQVFAYIGICFECSKIEVSDSKIFRPDLCDYMYRCLEAFFNRMGIKTSAYELRENGK